MPVYLVTTSRIVEQVGYVEVYAESEAAATSAVILDEDCVRDHIVWHDGDRVDEFRVNRAHLIRHLDTYTSDRVFSGVRTRSPEQSERDQQRAIQKTRALRTE